MSTDDKSNDIHLVKENKNSATQAISGQGCRPTRRWIFDRLNELFPYVYLPKTQPKHKEFPTEWNNFQNETNTLTRAIFIASWEKINSDKLTNEFINSYEDW